MSGKQKAKNAINIGKFYGEASCLLNYAITSLDQIRGYAINVKFSEYKSTLGRITSYSKSFKKLGKEFNKEVTKHGENMYSNITSNKSPYKKITYYTSYGDRVAHVHKNSEACKFFTSSTYKNAVALGKFTNIVMPIVSSILTSYVVYKRFIAKSPNSKSPMTGDDWEQYFKEKYGVNNVEWVTKNGEYVPIQNRGCTGRIYLKNVEEQIAMDATRQSPFNNNSKKIISNLGDKWWEHWQKWQVVYKAKYGKTITIHFVYDPKNKLFDDFKFK